MSSFSSKKSRILYLEELLTMNRICFDSHCVNCNKYVIVKTDRGYHHCIDCKKIICFDCDSPICLSCILSRER